MKSKLVLAALFAVLVSGCTKHADPVVVVQAPAAESSESIQRKHDARLEAMTCWQLIDEGRVYARKAVAPGDALGAAKASVEFTAISDVFERKLKQIPDAHEMNKIGTAWVVMTADAMSGK